MRSLLTLAAGAGLAAAGRVAETMAEAAADTYDYIVVGSGPGGGPLAANLARANQSVLLIEAGTDDYDNPEVSDIQNFIAASNDPNFRWDFWVKHSDNDTQERAFEHYVYRRPDDTFYIGTSPPASAKPLGIWYPRTATLGGCAMHNAALAQVPPDEDWDIVMNRTGDKSWEASNMRKYFERIEANTYLPRGTPGHGFDGWVNISQGYNYAVQPGSDGYLIDSHLAMATGQSGVNITTQVLRDLNSLSPTRDTDTGFYGMVGHIDQFGKRSGPITYIRSTLRDSRKFPLTLKLHAHVTKVLFNTSTGGMSGGLPQAIGVEVLDGAYLYGAAPKRNATAARPKPTQIYARKEVIVSGGTFNSPQILKLSGIGPKEELAKFNIPLIKDLPGVGENMGDNYEASLLNIAARDLNDTGGQVVLMMRTNNAPTKNRNIYAFCGSFSFEGFWPGYPTDYGMGQYECALVHMSPKSQAGYVRLRSADPLDTPDINFNFYKNRGDEDLSELLDAMKTLRGGLNMIPKNNTMLPFEEQHPCPGVGETCSDAAQKQMIKEQAYSHHATSSCAIGGDSDPMAVLDSKFRVRGVKGLRVVDASAFPVVPGAFPVVPTMILSEKAFDAILKDI